jgi:hypothetical protein
MGWGWWWGWGWGGGTAQGGQEESQSHISPTHPPAGVERPTPHLELGAGQPLAHRLYLRPGRLQLRRERGQLIGPVLRLRRRHGCLLLRWQGGTGALAALACGRGTRCRR